MAELLEKSNSSYFPSFKSMFRDVVSGRSILLTCSPLFPLAFGDAGFNSGI